MATEKEKQSHKAWDYLNEQPEANDFLTVLSQILNGGVMQLYDNKGVHSTVHLAESSIRFVNKYASSYTGAWEDNMNDVIELQHDYSELKEAQQELGYKYDDEDIDAIYNDFQNKTNKIDTEIYEYDSDLIINLYKNFVNAKNIQKRKLTQVKAHKRRT